MNSSISALAGLGFFLTGLNMLTKGIQDNSGSRIWILISKISKGKFNLSLTGLVLGTLTQNFTASAIICIGLLNAGTISLASAMTITAWSTIGSALLVFLASVNLYTAGIFAVGIVGLSHFVRLSVHSWAKTWGSIGFSAGIMFFGLGLLKKSGQEFQHSPGVVDFFLFAGELPFAMVISGIVLSLLTQSSSIVSVLAITFQQAEIIPLEATLLLIIGANVGSGISVSLHASHLTGWPQQLAIWQGCTRIIGALFAIILLLFIPNTDEAKPALVVIPIINQAVSVTTFIALFFLYMQMMGAIISVIFQPYISNLLGKICSTVSVQQILSVKHLYAEATKEATTGLLLAYKELQEWISTLPISIEALDPQIRQPSYSAEDRHAAAKKWLMRIDDFIQECARQSTTATNTQFAYDIRGVIETLHALNDTLLSFAENAETLHDSEELYAMLDELRSQMKSCSNHLNPASYKTIISPYDENNLPKPQAGFDYGNSKTTTPTDPQLSQHKLSLIRPVYERAKWLLTELKSLSSHLHSKSEKLNTVVILDSTVAHKNGRS